MRGTTGNKTEVSHPAKDPTIILPPDDLQADPAYVRAEEFSAQYFRDVWRLADTIARKRDSTVVQKTVADINLADLTMRSGFPRRRLMRKITGQSLSALGALFAGAGVTGLWTQTGPSSEHPWSLVALVVGIIVAIIGFVVTCSAD